MKGVSCSVPALLPWGTGPSRAANLTSGSGAVYTEDYEHLAGAVLAFVVLEFLLLNAPGVVGGGPLGVLVGVYGNAVRGARVVRGRGGDGGLRGDPVLAAVVTLMLYYVLVILVSLPR